MIEVIINWGAAVQQSSCQHYSIWIATGMSYSVSDNYHQHSAAQTREEDCEVELLGSNQNVSIHLLPIRMCSFPRLFIRKERAVGKYVEPGFV